MANDTKFINGLIVKAPNDNAPEYVKAKLSIKREELIAWLQTESGEWINADIKVSSGGKWYAAVDTWVPNQGNGTSRNNAPKPPRRDPAPATTFDSEPFDDQIPFISSRGTF